MPDWEPVIQALSDSEGQAHVFQSAQQVGGGSINTAYKITTNKNIFFLKLNRLHAISMFEAEADGLKELANSTAFHVPHVYCTGQTQSHSFILMEYIPLATNTEVSAQRMGEALANMHHEKQLYFGWHRDNTIGLTLQINSKTKNWEDFWKNKRLRYQLSLAIKNSMTARLQDKINVIIDKQNCLFQGYSLFPSRLHGDLWGGNVASDTDENPVIFDPALYYGDREADIAMTELFGGFNNEFYQAYQTNFPLDPGYAVRKWLYNLYHLLNHFNLFGSSYLAQIEAAAERLIAEF